MSEEDRTRVQRSAWRFYLALDRCPSDCPFREQCGEFHTCQLYDQMRAEGEMRPRAWESIGWDVEFAQRVNQAEAERRASR